MSENSPPPSAVDLTASPNGDLGYEHEDCLDGVAYLSVIPDENERRWIWLEQHGDRRADDGEPIREVVMTPRQARKVAAMLMRAADVADRLEVENG